MNRNWTLLLNLAAAAGIGYAAAAWHLHAQGDAATAAASLREAAARARGSVVTIYADASEPGSMTLGIGSGVVVDTQGGIVTTSALAGPTGELRVALPDGRLLHARLLGTDTNSGLALLQADGTALQPIRMGDLTRTAVGDPVLALGDAVGTGITATQGVVSAIGPGQLRDRAPGNFIQTDAMLHAGSLGGALVDSSGRLLGVTVGSVSGANGAEALAVAVPVDRVQQIVTHLAPVATKL